MKERTSKYSVDEGNVRISRDITKKVKVPSGIEQSFKKVPQGVSRFVPLKNKEGKALNDYQYVALMAELGESIEGCNKEFVNWCKNEINSNKSEYEVNKDFKELAQKIFIKE
jgi:hypothetical protein